jgi:hypothetical protein
LNSIAPTIDASGRSTAPVVEKNFMVAAKSGEIEKGREGLLEQTSKECGASRKQTENIRMDEEGKAPWVKVKCGNVSHKKGCWSARWPVASPGAPGTNIHI